MDKYDRAIEHLREHPEDVWLAWHLHSNHPAGCLFAYTAPGCGCLTQVKCGRRAPTDELTIAIQSDGRIPENNEDITLEHLPVFAEWQRRLDKELGRET